jgi:hypothetical protein
MAREHELDGRELRDVREILQRIVRELRSQCRIDREFGRRSKQRVTVGRRACDELRAENAGCAAPVLDEEARAGLPGELQRPQPPDDAETAAGPVRHDDANGTRRPRLRRSSLGGRRLRACVDADRRGD